MGRPNKWSQKQVYNAIRQYINQHDIPPTIDELQILIGMGCNRTVLRYLRRLEEDGWIRRWHGGRGIKLLRDK